MFGIPAEVHPEEGKMAVSHSLFYHRTATVVILITTLLFSSQTHGYIPAQATNDTTITQNAGTNLTDISRIKIQWYPGASYSGQIAQVLVAPDSDGINKVRTLIAITIGPSPRYPSRTVVFATVMTRS